MPVCSRLVALRPPAIQAFLAGLLAVFGLSACSDDASAPPAAGQNRTATHETDAPLDSLARAAAERLAADPGRLTLPGANGLERFGVRWKEQAWIDAARARFVARLADDRPLDASESEAFLERYAELDLNPAWLERVERDGVAGLRLPVPNWATAQRWSTALSNAEDDNELLATWGRAHAWFGHVWINGGSEAFSFDGFDLARVEGGWHATDRLGIERDFTLRRQNGHASMRHVSSMDPIFLPDEIGGH